MSLKSIMRRVSEEKTKRGTNVLGENRPIGALQRSISTTREYRERQARLHARGTEVLEEAADKPLTKQQSVERERSRTRRKGKAVDRDRSMAARKAHKKRTASSYAKASKARLRTGKRLGTITPAKEEVESPTFEVMAYHEMLADMDEQTRNEYFSEINEVGLDPYVEYLDDVCESEGAVEGKCREPIEESRRKMKEQDDEEEDEDDEEMDEKKSKKESRRRVKEQDDEEEDEDDEEMDEKKSKKESKSKVKEQDEEEEDDEEPADENMALRMMMQKKKKKRKESVDPIGEMLAGEEESSQVDQGDLDPVGKDKKTKDLDKGDQVVGKDPGTDSTVQNPKGDSSEYPDKGDHSFDQGQNRGQISGYGY